MRTYKTQMLTSAIPAFYPDEVAPAVAAPVVAPALPGSDEKTALEQAAAPAAEAKEEAKEEPKVEAKEEPKVEAKEEPKVEAPVVPEAYELKVQVDGKDVELDPAAVAAATPIFKEAGLTNDQAQAVVSHYATSVLPNVAQAVQQDTLKLLGMDGMGEWAKQLKADKDIGGAKYEENLTVIAQGRDAFATPELRALLETSRLGNHPEIARLFHKLGSMVKEGTVHVGQPAPTPSTAEAILYGPEYQPKA